MWLAHESEPTNLAAFGLAAITQGIFYRIVIATMHGGQATFTSQAFGAKQFRLCWVYMYRQIVINVVIWAFIGIFMIYLEPIYLACG